MVSILTPDDVVVIDGTQDGVEGFLVQLIAAFNRPIVDAQVAASVGCEALPCPCGGRGACCNAAWNDDPDPSL
jgi:hypothetical protein